MKPIRNILEKHDEGIFEIKEKISEVIEKNIGQLQNQLPSEDECKSAFSNTSCSAQGDGRATNKLNTLKSKINSVRNPIEQATKNLQRLKDRLNKLKGNIQTLESILVILDELLPILRVAAEGLPLILYSQAFPGPGIQGTVVVATHDKIEALKAKIEEIIASFKIYLEEIPKKYEEIDKLMKLIEEGIETLNGIKNKGDELVKLLELSYLAYLQNCALGSGETGADGLIGDENVNHLVTESGNELEINIDELLGELSNQGQTEVITKIFNANLEMIAYKRYKV